MSARRPLGFLARRDDRGLTLVEMLVAMSVSMVLLAAVGTLTVRMVKYLDVADKRNTATLQSTEAFDAISKQIRTAYAPGGASAVILAGRETFGFYANVNSLDLTATATVGSAAFQPQEIWIWTEAVGTNRRRLCEQVRSRTVNASNQLVAMTPDLSVAGNRKCRELVSSVAAPDTSKPTFTYLASTDTLSASGAAVSSLVLGTSGNVSITTNIDSVEVSIRANAGTRTRPDVVTTLNRVTFANKQTKGTT